jgi:ABC-type proline/glycine betaine transport system substrate-binding protein
MQTALVTAALLATTAGAADLTLTLGTPGVSFHQCANRLAVRGLERLGYTVTVVDQLPHRDMYPLFTGPNATVDAVTGADLPYNHAQWLEPAKDEFSVVGTMNEATDIIVSVTAGAGVAAVSELGAPPAGFVRVLVGLDENTCPACVTNGNALIASVPGMENYTYEAHNSSDLIATVGARAAAGEAFAVVWYVPTYLNGALPGLTRLAGDVAPFDQTNQGKTLVRNDRLDKLTPAAVQFLGAVFAGNAHIVEMDTWVNAGGLAPTEAADRWIAENADTFEMFSW